MGDLPFNPDSNGNSEARTVAVRKKNVYKGSLGVADSEALARTAYKHIASKSHIRNLGGPVGDAAIFLLKVAALETVRRVSRSKCPPVWRSIQALQFVSIPPFKWILKWAPLKGLAKGMQMFSRPLLFLSVATTISELTESDSGTPNNNNVSHARSDSETSSHLTNPNASLDASDDNLQSIASENWLIQLHKELENQGITLPERIDEEELQRFFAAANGDFSCLLSSVTRTIRWRETYRILSEKELEIWSSMVFWHGFDVEHRPCLIVRLGLACLNLPSNERPRFAQAVISQVEHGVLKFINRDNPQITVVVDCHGISPLRVPMQMLRTCSSLLQDNFPNRLGHLLVIRLPPVVRVISQTFIQVLKPVTRKKLRIEGSRYRHVISEYLETLPAYLGGSCECKICLNTTNRQVRSMNEIRRIESTDDGEDLVSPSFAYEDEYPLNETWDHLVRTAAIGILMVCLFIALLAVLYDPENRPF